MWMAPLSGMQWWPSWKGAGRYLKKAQARWVSMLSMSLAVSGLKKSLPPEFSSEIWGSRVGFRLESSGCCELLCRSL